MWCLWNFFPNQNGRMRGVRLQRYDAQWMLKVTVHKQMTYTTKGFQILPYLSKKWILQNMTLIKFWAITVNITLGPAPLQFFQFNAKCKLNKAYNRMFNMYVSESHIRDGRLKYYLGIMTKNYKENLVFKLISSNRSRSYILYLWNINPLEKKHYRNQ